MSIHVDGETGKPLKVVSVLYDSAVDIELNIVEQGGHDLLARSFRSRVLGDGSANSPAKEQSFFHGPTSVSATLVVTVRIELSSHCSIY